MTTVYGVTRYGAKLQITKQLKGKFHFSMYVKYLTKEKRFKVYCYVPKRNENLF